MFCPSTCRSRCASYSSKSSRRQGPAMQPNETETGSDRERLRARWAELWRRLVAAPQGVPEVNELFAAYDAPARSYHNMRHIQQCLEEFDAHLGMAQSPDAVEVAIWFHDVVYDPKRHDNEERAADLAAQMLGDAGVGGTLV